MNKPDAPQEPADSATIAPGAVQGRPDTAQAFISYASPDISIANAVCHTLERAGVKCWIAPRDVAPGELYAANIVHAIDTTRLVVLVLSQHAADSAHVLREVERACSKRHTILSFRTDLAQLPEGLEYFLNTSHWLDASEIGVDRALPRLVDAVKSVLAKPTVAAPVSQSQFVAVRPNFRPRQLLILLGVLIAAAFAYVGVDRFWLSKRVDAQSALVETSPAPSRTDPESLAITKHSIAVLPFVDMSAEKNQEYMSDGIAEELLNLLAQVPDLNVIARTSSFAFKGQNIDIGEIAKKLKVAHVLEGSVRKSGNKLRVTAQLIRTADSTHLWSQSYDRPLDDIFAVQDEIAGAIVQALQIQLAGGELSRKKGGTQNLEAYQLYLRSKSAMYLGTPSSVDAARDYLEKAILLDSSYGLAYSQLASAYMMKTQNGWLDATEGYERARQLAKHALQLSPDNSMAHAALAYVHRTLDWNWVAAESEVRRALAIDPTSPDALDVAGALYYTLGRWNEAERKLLTALDRDPLNTFILWDLGTTYYLAGRFADAERMFRRVLELAPHNAWTPGWLGKTLLAQGKPEEALAMVQQEVDAGVRLGYLPIVLQAVGRQSEADEALEAQIAQWADTCAICVARTYAYRADNDRAFEWLERAYKQKDTSLTQFVGEPLFKNLENDPRFKDFLRKMNLPEV